MIRSADGAKSESEDEARFATYLAKRLTGEKRFRSGAPNEAAPLVAASDIVLTHAELALSIVCIIDGESNPRKRFSLSQREVIEIGRACLPYTGTVNGTKMPVTITIYEIAPGPPSEADRARMQALAKNFPGFGKVAIRCFHLDLSSKTVFSSAFMNGLLGGRRWLEAALREPRKQDGEIFVPDAALPRRDRKPIATAAILALLSATFVVEQMARVGDKASGLFGVGPATLFALGGMNAGAVSKEGEWYRILTAALLHADAFHLLLNGVALGLAGYLLESLVGRAWLINLFFWGAMGGSLFGLAFNSANVVSVGASGAVMALLAAALVASTRFPPGVTRAQMQMQLLQFLVPSLIPLATHRQGGHVDFAAHFGGAMVGALAGWVLVRIWPKKDEQPRFRHATNGLAIVAVLCFVSSSLLAKSHYADYAREMSFSAADHLVEDAKIPMDVTAAKNDVESWGKDRPRDPRVHFFRALRLLDQKNEPLAETELRAALAEREILDKAFGNKKLETGIRAVLCELLLQQGRREEAKREAQPVCKSEHGSAPKELRALDLCE